ncbi:MAG: class I SAM-dependent methyltransferase [Elusimicrobia bacterium]|nr:class I SAM-dependent methyltransferase [Elusimicrobiota bacterium]
MIPEIHIKGLEELAGGYWWHVHRRRMVVELARRYGGPAGEGYLDIGCGPGATTWRIAEDLSRAGLIKSSGQALGIDGDPRLEPYCRSHGIRFVRQDLEAGISGLPSERFSFFTALDVLEHLTRPDDILAQLKPYLAPGALGIVTVPAFQFLFSDWDTKLGHHRRYRIDSLSEVFESAGYEMVWASYLYSFVFPAACLRRKSGKVEASLEDSVVEFPKLPAWLNRILNGACSAERQALSMLGRLPFGTSVIAAARPRS